MKKISLLLALLTFSVGGIAQNSVLLTPSGNETQKFSNTVGEKITLFDNGATSKHGIGLTSVFGGSRFNFYTPTANDDFVFGFGVNGSLTLTERFRIKGNGNIGIGTTTPNAPLQFANTTPNRKIVLFETVNNDNQFYGFGVNTDGITGVLRYQVGSSTNNDHVFYAGSSATTSNELVRIKGNGNVGIGTNNPANRLSVVGSNFEVMTIDGPAQTYMTFKETGLSRGYIGSYYGAAEDFDLGTELANSLGKVHLTTGGAIRLTVQDAASGGNIEIAGRIINEAMQTPTFQNSWTNYGAGYAEAKYYKDKENRVHLNGGITRASATSNTVIFQLPVGYRPSANLTFHVDALNGYSARIAVFSDGNVYYASANSNSNNEHQYVSLSGISFRLD